MTSFEDARAGAQSERAVPRLGPPLRSPAGKRFQGQATQPVSDHRVGPTLRLSALMASSSGGVELQLATEGAASKPWVFADQPCLRGARW